MDEWDEEYGAGKGLGEGGEGMYTEISLGRRVMTSSPLESYGCVRCAGSARHYLHTGRIRPLVELLPGYPGQKQVLR